MSEQSELTRKANEEFGKLPNGWTWHFQIEGRDGRDGQTIYTAYARCFHSDGTIETDRVPAGSLSA